jgi:hypothetical protein
MDFQDIFRAALNSEESPVIALRQAVLDLRAQNVEKDTILKALESFRYVVENEDEEDIVLEVMDFLVGFCSPHLRID